MTSYGFRPYGNPSPQGSKVPGVTKSGKPFVREQSGQKLTDWRRNVTHANLLARGIDPDTGNPVSPDAPPIPTITGACAVQMQILLPRPASIPARKRPHPTVAPDLDKMVRAILDAMKVAGAFSDDALVVKIWATKIYADSDGSGAIITVSDHLD